MSSAPSPPADGSSSSSSVAQRIAAAFVDACTPSTKSYADQLAAFCAEALIAYCSGYSLVAVQLEMTGEAGGGGSLGRGLASDEAELRSVWLTLVYKTLRQIRFPIDGVIAGVAPPEGTERDRLDEFVKNIVAAARTGYDMKRIQLEQALTSTTSSEGGTGTPPARTPLENAILNQSTRIVLTTLQVAEERKTQYDT
jgi:hypothetical protein